MAILASFPKGKLGQRYRWTAVIQEDLVTLFISLRYYVLCQWLVPNIPPAWLAARHPELRSWSVVFSQTKQTGTPPASSVDFSAKETTSRNFSALVLGTLDYCDLTACVQLIQLQAQVTKWSRWCVLCLKLLWVWQIKDLINEKIIHRLLFYVQLVEEKLTLTALTFSTKPLQWYTGIWITTWLAASSSSVP